ncbi:MAG: putative ABC transporter permease [Ruthenibacterium lactatiformans]
MFHTSWWDYSDVPFNLGGYICLKFSLAWGVAVVAVMKGVQPAVAALVRASPARWALCCCVRQAQPLRATWR